MQPALRQHRNSTLGARERLLAQHVSDVLFSLCRNTHCLLAAELPFQFHVALLQIVLRSSFPWRAAGDHVSPVLLINNNAWTVQMQLALLWLLNRNCNPSFRFVAAALRLVCWLQLPPISDPCLTEPCS